MAEVQKGRERRPGRKKREGEGRVFERSEEWRDRRPQGTMEEGDGGDDTEEEVGGGVIVRGGRRRLRMVDSERREREEEERERSRDEEGDMRGKPEGEIGERRLR